MNKYKDLTGQVFNKLTVLSRHSDNNTKNSYWLCQCECGKTLIKRAGYLEMQKRCCPTDKPRSHKKKLNGDVIKLERKPSLEAVFRKEYKAWRQMIYRCTRPHHHNFKWYGGKGVKVCDNWMISFENFFNDIGPAPSKKHSLERIKVDSDYELSNCRWATFIEQMNNRTDNKYVTHNGIKKSLTIWCREINIEYKKAYYMLKKGMSFDEVISIMQPLT